MNEIETALDDLDGLHEAFRALLDTQRANAIAGKAKLAKTLGRELAGALDAYVSTVISTSRGELDPKRVRKCRAAGRRHCTSAGCSSPLRPRSLAQLRHAGWSGLSATALSQRSLRASRRRCSTSAATWE